ncbi:MAG: peptide chain release factor N(5)-glutamine methyltransferase [Hyphomicrobiaceae bacterium]
MTRPTNLRDVIQSVRLELAAAAIDDPAAEARRLVAEAAGLRSTTIIAEPDARLSSAQLSQVDAWARRRSHRETLARLRGWQDFYGRRFLLSADTLEPRADSEALIDATLALIDKRQGRDHPWRIVDVGAGTGCLAVTLLAELPNANAIGTDLSLGALTTAMANANALEVEQRCAWVCCDVMAALVGPFDILISNPPYVAEPELDQLQPEVLHNDPRLALAGGNDGLAMYRRLAEQLLDFVPDGMVILETADNDDHRVSHVFSEIIGSRHLSQPKVWRDLTGVGRCVTFETRA